MILANLTKKTSKIAKNLDDGHLKHHWPLIQWQVMWIHVNPLVDL